MSTEKKYIEWDLEKFKAGWPADAGGSRAHFVAHAPELHEQQRLIWRVGAMGYHSNDKDPVHLRLLARELDPHPDNKDGLYRDQIGDGWRIKGHDEKHSPDDEYWDGSGWCRARPTKVRAACTYRTRDPLPEPMFKVGDRVVNTQKEKGEVVKVDPMLGNSAVRVRYDDGTFGTYTMEGTVRFTDNSAAITKLTTRIAPLGPEDIVLGKTVVRVVCGECRYLVRAANKAGLWFHSDAKQATWEEIRDTHEISHDHGATWKKAEKEVEG